MWISCSLIWIFGFGFGFIFGLHKIRQQWYSKRVEQSNYFLRVVKDGEKPTWPVPDTELIVGSQELGRGFTQYWAYPKSDGIDAGIKPEAENLAASYLSSKPAVLIDQQEELLDLILVHDGHAWAKTESSLDNLEDNLSSILEFAKEEFNIKIEHFMTTQKVSREAEEKLDAIEGNRPVEQKDSSDPATSVSGTPDQGTDNESEPVDSFKNLTSQNPKSVFRGDLAFEIARKGKSKLPRRLVFLTLILALAAGGWIYKDKFLSLFPLKPQSTSAPIITAIPTPAPDASPTPPFDRSRYNLRVLNGTTKTGAAATLSDKLKAIGWQVTITGNATDSATLRSYVRVKAEAMELAAALIQDLAPDLDATRSADIKADDRVDAEVVIGKK